MILQDHLRSLKASPLRRRCRGFTCYRVPSRHIVEIIFSRSAGPQELREHLRKFGSRPFAEALSDFHLLLYLAAQPNFDLAADINHIATAVKERGDVGEGYKMIVESIAGI